jgi:hypothetical protein
MPIEDYATLLDALAADTTARRELLWLAAMGNGAVDLACELEDLEEGLHETMTAVVDAYVARGYRMDKPKHRRRAYERLFEERLRYHEQRLLAEAALDLRLPFSDTLAGGALGMN